MIDIEKLRARMRMTHMSQDVFDLMNNALDELQASRETIEKLEEQRDKYVRKYHIAHDQQGILNLTIERQTEELVLLRELRKHARYGPQMCAERAVRKYEEWRAKQEKRDE